MDVVSTRKKSLNTILGDISFRGNFVPTTIWADADADVLFLGIKSESRMLFRRKSGAHNLVTIQASPVTKIGVTWQCLGDKNCR